MERHGRPLSGARRACRSSSRRRRGRRRSPRRSPSARSLELRRARRPRRPPRPPPARARGGAGEPRRPRRSSASAALVAAMLAIVKAGGAYVPLDPDLPRERLDLPARRLAACGRSSPRRGRAAGLRRRGPRARPRAELAAGATARPPPSRPPAATASPMSSTPRDRPARPRGSRSPHRAVARLVARRRLRPAAAAATASLQVANASFDAITWEVWGPLLSGGTIVGSPGRRALTPGALGRGPAASSASPRRSSPPRSSTRWRATTRAPSAACRHLLVGGEAVDPRWVREVLASGAPPRRLLDVYGPTESTTFASWHELRDAAAGRRPGADRPADRQHPRSTCSTRGSGRCRRRAWGSWPSAATAWRAATPGAPGATARSFLPDPFSPTCRAPGSTAPATWRASGRTASATSSGGSTRRSSCAASASSRARSRRALVEHPAVAAAAVVLREDAPGERRLVAYSPCRGGPQATAEDLAAELRDFLAARLPALHGPRRLRPPRRACRSPPTARSTAAALARRPGGGGAAGRRGAPLRTAAESELAAIWADAPGASSPASTRTSSPSAATRSSPPRLISRVRRELGVELPLCAPSSRGRRSPGWRPRSTACAAAGRRRRGAAAHRPAGAARRRRCRSPSPRSASGSSTGSTRAPASTTSRPPSACTATSTSRPCAARPGGDRRAPRGAAHDLRRGRRAGRCSGSPRRRRLPAAARRPDGAAAGAPRGRGGAALAAAAGRRFDLARGPLARGLAVRLAPRDHAVVFAFHHIVFDGWSIGVFVRELSALYARRRRRPPGGAAAARRPVRRLRRVAARAGSPARRSARELAYWRERLAGAPATWRSPADRPRPAVAERARRSLAARPAARRRRPRSARSPRRAATPFMALLAAFVALLARHTGQRGPRGRRADRQPQPRARRRG